MMKNDKIGPARAIWRFALRQKARWREARVARCRASSDQAILKTREITIDPQSSIEIHCLTCERDYLDLLWCLKSLRYFAGRPFDLVIHDDGSLSEMAIASLHTHLRGVHIVSKEAADALVAARMALTPASKAFREKLRLFDFPVIAKREQFMILDSDVLFFSAPNEMLGLMDRGIPFFMSDYQDGYVHAREVLASRYNVELMPAFNTGVSYFSKVMDDRDFIERYCSDAERNGLLSHPWTEQTLFALLFARQAGLAKRLSPQHSISRTPIDEQTVCHHFVNDGSRGDFYVRGIRRLRRIGFVRDAMASG
jgi:hypothetical protein